jgi:phytoene dehydrogenase-like protein
MPLGQRVVLIGGGHNALITAFYLAKGGFRPLVLERREFVGGGAITEEFYPGFFASTLAHTVGPLRADVARDMQVENFDCQILHPDPRVFAPAPDGRALLFFNDHAKTASGIAHLLQKTPRNTRNSPKYSRKSLASSARSSPSLRPRLTNPRPKISGIFSRPAAASAASASRASSI